ncbi:hypothetical protein LCGC14_1925280, partial [marine sediment metagenome]
EKRHGIFHLKCGEYTEITPTIKKKKLCSECQNQSHDSSRVENVSTNGGSNIQSNIHHDTPEESTNGQALGKSPADTGSIPVSSGTQSPVHNGVCGETCEECKDTFNLSDKRLGYGKILKKMDTGEYNFLSKELNDIAEGFVYPEKDVKEFIRLLKDLAIDRYYSMNEKKHYLSIAWEDIDKLVGKELSK